MQKLIVAITIFLILSVSTFYGMEGGEMHQTLAGCPVEDFLENYNQEGENIDQELKELTENAHQAFEEQRAKAEISQRKTQQLERTLLVGMYSVAGIVIVTIGIILYDAWKKAKAEKNEA